MPFDRATFDETLTNARGRLLAARNAAGHWEGELSEQRPVHRDGGVRAAPGRRGI